MVIAPFRAFKAPSYPERYLSVRSSIRMSKPIPQVEQGKFEEVLRRLLRQKPVKRSEVKTDAKKPGKLIQPQK